MGIKYGSRDRTWNGSRTLKTGSGANARRLPLPEVRFLELMNQLDPTLREVVRRALFEDRDRFQKFASAPASTRGHHSGRSGNLLHTIDVAECALLLARHYEELVDKQVVLAAALLHDLGKCEEYQDSSGETTMSDAGEMVGHKVIGCAMVWAALEPLRTTNTERALAVMNAVASTLNRSYDLRGPATLEATIVSRADQLSAAADLYRESMRASGYSFVGVKHQHLPERPRHPYALATVVRAAEAVPWVSARAQRYGN